MRRRASGADLHVGRRRARVLLVAEGRLRHVGVRGRVRAGAGSGGRPACASPTSPATSPRCSGSPSDPVTGLRDWLRVGAEAPTDALDRLAVDVAPRADVAAGRAAPIVATVLAGGGRRARGRAARRPGPTIVDVGVLGRAARRRKRWWRLPTRTSIVRARLLPRAAARGAHAGARPTRPARCSIDEHGRALGARDVADVLGVPVLATVSVAIVDRARAVDAGVLAGAAARRAGASPRARCWRRIGCSGREGRAA